MAGESYVIDAQLRLNATRANSQLQSFGSRLSSLGAAISGSNSGLLGMVAGFSAIAAGVTVVNTLVGGFERLTSGAVQYRTTMEGLELQTSAVMSAVDHIDFDAARERAHGLFEQYRIDAIASVATTEQLVMISNAIMGPLRGAGQGMEVVRDMTNMTVTAATALGVDLAQASRDMQLMINGSAGMHVRLYQMLHATGAIAEDAHAFNQLTSTERIARLQSALGRFQGAATAYGQSFAGATSTFQDIVDNLVGTFYGPAFNRLRQFLLDVNDRLITNREAIERVLTRLGTWFGNAVGSVFDQMLSGMDYIGAHWDEIVTKIRSVVADVREMIPLLMDAAKAWVAISVARSVIGGGASAAGGIVSMVSGLVGGTGGGAAAAGAATSMAGAGAVVATEGAAITYVEAAAAASAAIAADAAAVVAAETAFAGALATVAAPLLLVAGAVLVVAGVLDAMAEHAAYFQYIATAAGAMLNKIGGDLMDIAGDVWSVVQPFLELLGFNVAGGTGFVEMLAAIHNVLAGLRQFTVMLRDLGEWLGLHVGHSVDAAAAANQKYVEALTGVVPPAAAAARAVDQMSDSMEALATARAEEIANASRAIGDTGMTGTFGRFVAPSMQFAHAPPAHLDMRGSRITIQQEFREADPDRMLVRLRDDLQAQAERRIQSPLGGIGGL